VQILVLALIAVASAQILLAGGISDQRLHPGIASSSDSGIRRYGSTGGILVGAPALVGGPVFL